MSIQTINPATEEIIQIYEEMNFPFVETILNKMHSAQKNWRDFSVKKRAENLMRVAHRLKTNKADYAKIITTEMGKPILSAIAEIEKCQWVCEYYATQAENFLQDKVIQTNLTKSYITYKPLGIIFAIMPWNYPFWQVFRFAAPNLMAGNTCLLNHAPISTGTGFVIEKLFQEVCEIENIFRTIIVDHAVSKKVMENNLICGVTLTGSERAGHIVGAQSGAALKKVVLELGGNDPYIILDDANLEIAADNIVKSRINNSGQVCIAAKRIIADQNIHDALLSKILEKIKSIRMGDPLNQSNHMGPIARKDLRETVDLQVQLSIQKGATLICGGKIPNQIGFYYPPTVLTHVRPGMPAFDDEIFGPVIAMIKVENEKEAIQLANQTRFGLAGAVFTENLARGEKIARDEVNSGTCYVNGLVSSDPRLPFGGIQSSGYGRELGAEGIYAFTNIKTIGVV